MPAAVRALLLVPAAVSGVVAGLLGSFVHPLEPAGVPLGLLVALALSAAVFVTWGLLLGRSGSVAAAAGWLVVVLLLSTQRPEGDLVVAGSAEGYLWLLGGTAVAVACCVPRYGRPAPLPAPGGPAAPSAGAGPGR